MQALAIVTFTLTGLVSVLFGSDYLDRRLAGRAGDASPHPPDDDDDAGTTDTPTRGPDPVAAVARPAAGCRHGRGGRPARVPQTRIGGPHGPIAVTPDRWTAGPPAPAPRSDTPA